MQLSNLNTFPLVLKSSLLHNIRVSCQYTYITFSSKKPTDSGNLNHLCHEDEHLPTENKLKEQQCPFSYKGNWGSSF